MYYNQPCMSPSQGPVVVSLVHHGMLCVQVCTDNDINTDSTDHYMYYRDKGRMRGVNGGRWGGLYARGIIYSFQTYSQQ